MADAGKEAKDAAVETTSTPEPPAPSPNASVKVSCAHPTSKFHAGDDIPVITREGTMLTKAQVQVAEKAAESCRVRLVIEEGAK